MTAAFPHREPVPLPDDDPLPDKKPTPDDEPVPHPDPEEFPKRTLFDLDPPGDTGFLLPR